MIKIAKLYSYKINVTYQKAKNRQVNTILFIFLCLLLPCLFFIDIHTLLFKIVFSLLALLILLIFVFNLNKAKNILALNRIFYAIDKDNNIYKIIYRSDDKCFDSSQIAPRLLKLLSSLDLNNIDSNILKIIKYNKIYNVIKEKESFKVIVENTDLEFNKTIPFVQITIYKDLENFAEFIKKLAKQKTSFEIPNNSKIYNEKDSLKVLSTKNLQNSTISSCALLIILLFLYLSIDMTKELLSLFITTIFYIIIFIFLSYRALINAQELSQRNLKSQINYLKLTKITILLSLAIMILVLIIKI